MPCTATPCTNLSQPLAYATSGMLLLHTFPLLHMTEWAHLLNRLREGNHTSDDLSFIKRTMAVTKKHRPTPSDPRLFATNDQVNRHNGSVVDVLSKEGAGLARLPAQMLHDIQSPTAANCRHA